MRIGLTGSHRTGKTTLAEKLAHKLDLPFVPTSTSSLMIANGFDPKRDYGVKDRLWIQQKILNSLEKIYQEQSPSGFVTDRTPLDAAAYMLADVTRDNMTEELSRDITKYVLQCYEVTNRHFGLLLFIPPAIAVKDEPGKAPATSAYMDHIHFLISGLVNSKRLDPPWAGLPSQFVDLEDRVVWGMSVFSQVFQNVSNSRREFEMSGGKIH